MLTARTYSGQLASPGPLGLAPPTTPGAGAVETFLPRTGTQTSVLILRRKSEQEKLAESLSGEASSYKVFMAIANKVGKDRRGNVIFRRDAEGREIIQRELYEQFFKSTVLDFYPTVETSGRIVDDHLPRIASEFRQQQKTREVAAE
jgi:type I restriction enzyme M protein